MGKWCTRFIPAVAAIIRVVPKHILLFPWCTCCRLGLYLLRTQLRLILGSRQKTPLSLILASFLASISLRALVLPRRLALALPTPLPPAFLWETNLAEHPLFTRGKGARVSSFPVFVHCPSAEHTASFNSYHSVLAMPHRTGSQDPFWKPWPSPTSLAQVLIISCFYLTL